MTPEEIARQMQITQMPEAITALNENATMHKFSYNKYQNEIINNIAENMKANIDLRMALLETPPMSVSHNDFKKQQIITERKQEPKQPSFGVVGKRKLDL